MSRHTGMSTCVLSLLSTACAVEPPELGGSEQAAQPAPAIDPRRSLAVTEAPILARFSLERVLGQLVGGSDTTARDLFQQTWDVFNPGPGLGRGPHCDDDVDIDGGPRLNDYPFSCRAAPSEGAQAACDPFVAGSTCGYLPIGLFMRFDLAPEDGGHCGEYRIVYAKETGRTASNDRALLIFEAALRNPHLNQGIRGCQKLVRAWAELSLEPDLEARADLLEEIYFDGYQEFDPVVQWSNFGDNPYGAGQLRTNQFVQPVTPRVWSLRELKLRRVCGATCTVRFEPVTDKVNPFAALFAAASPGTPAAAFQAELIARLPGLAAPSLGGIGLNVSDVYNSGQSQATSTSNESNFASHYAGAIANPFAAAIQAELTAIGSTLTPADIVARAQAMTCAGCHRFSNGAALGGGLAWPPSLGFTHISERDIDLELVDGITRYRISLALTDALLPARAQLITDYLDEVPRPVRPPDSPLGGRWVH